ncbi:UDP-GlcNAc:undecaprenyl-phosphate GlcNAc-1-phosphate transferase [Desulfomicrobium macestii]|uniref:UDP-GlcNAc:undecaprenyl-phosphate GlcNAc-1-phosphate transferase n=1 Tax=Desulfomicrobium macestii TaxID=90731 RepID=A0ABR9H5J8_9BACT|nr:MraY family glycosyltransferase [Desulfomicrobium macestii]MBE1425981.1 UDP-GlcNAc:undecaprenyl-phosphate GlcNAc-1-phosphate transferase [Desulfomicrobium macestii]
MNFLVSFYIAFLLSTLLVPVGIRLGRRWGIVDKPDPRKVHTGLIPRTGGMAIALATVVSLLVPLNMSRELSGYLGGGLVILVFGMWDDMRELGYRIKFFGQILAILFFTLVSGIQVTCLGELLPGLVVHLGPASIVLTIIFMLAVINIINLSDGLDGLAGGLSLLILLACAFLGYIQEAVLPIAITLAVCGGLVGFMRYNVHPAEVFMGDTGSQFLGFTIGACLIMLTQNHSIYTPILPLFLLGTPILDTAMVMYERIQAGQSPFKPDKNHLHHKLLRAGLTQEQAVVSIYFFHFTLILTGFALRFVADYVGLLLYALILGAGFAFRSAVQGKDVSAGKLYASIKSVVQAVFVWNTKSVNVRHCLSWLCWKSFFLLFTFFFFTNVYFIRHAPLPTALVALAVLGILALLYWKKTAVLVPFMYYAMLAVILYVVVFGEVIKADSVFLVMGPDGVTGIFYALSALYFACIILTPEKVPLNALDYILIAFISSLALMSEGHAELFELRQIAMKAVLLGLGLNLIYSRISRNRDYVLFLLALLCLEALVLAVTSGALLR